ncbi:unnamed protein product [Gongylonema pulchrum]|uniref:G_PROTEIN_RECEP_F1_2 domain-containing protein n=1 Tax=Gongylonema pulchrum TaxID=637853 RepID=A0A183D2B4_9BILA|nr:unnamed protein product [Gongylonema pulchrum]
MDITDSSAEEILSVTLPTETVKIQKTSLFIELLLNLCAYPFIAIFMKSVIVRKEFHRNLKLLLSNIPVFLMLMLMTRMILLVHKLQFINVEPSLRKRLEQICNCVMLEKGLCILSISLERFVALYYTKRYENCAYPVPFFGIGLTITQVILGYTK